MKVFINTPTETLAKLAKNEDGAVRCGVAINPNTPPETLTELAKNESRAIRCCLAKNPSLPREAIEMLLLDPKTHDCMLEQLFKQAAFSFTK